MRKADIEMLEVRLEPLQTARDRHNEAINANERHIKELADRVRDLERDAGAHATSIEQGLASIRSLLQRANRAAREQGIIEDEETLDDPQPVVNIPRSREEVIRGARARSVGRGLL